MTLLASDGAQIEVSGGSSVILDDDDETVFFEVLAGQATVAVGEVVVVLGEGETITDPGAALGDPDEDGLSNAEEALIGTDPANPDSDGDGLIDGLDASWLVDYLNGLPNNDFKRRWQRGAMKIRIAAAAIAVNLGHGELALHLTAALHKRIDGCGTTPDRNDWIVDCDSQVAFRELLGLYERGVASLPLPDPFGSG